MKTIVYGYMNSQGAVVVPECPDSGGEHSHHLFPDGSNYEQAAWLSDDRIVYICPFRARGVYPASSGMEILVIVQQ